MDLAAALVREGVLAPEAVSRALAAARDGDVASAALRLGICDEGALVRGLARAFECPGVDLSRSVLPGANLEVIAPDFCRERKVIPVTVGRSEIVLAMSDPDDLTLADEVRFVTGRKVLRHAAVALSIERALAGLAKARDTGQPAWRGAAAPALPDPTTGWAAIVKPGERTPPAVDLPDAPEKMELISASELVTPFQPPPQPPGPAPRRKLPEAPPPDPRAAEVPTVRLSGNAAGKVALVADDDREVLKLLSAVLTRLGCVVLEAQNGRQALEMARSARPDLVVLDAMMPGMHGFEVCRAIKGDRDLRAVPVILCSAIYRGTVGEDAQIAFGADAFVEKPFRVDDLTRVVKVALLGAGAAETPEERLMKADAERSWRAAAEALAAGKEVDAISWARAACQKDPRSAEAHYYLGHALSRQGQLYEAVAAYERAAELRPDVDAAHQCLAQTYERLGFQKSARESWARAIESCKDPARKKAMQARLMSLLGA
ncbi:MAG: response regulator [Deltaproteobacteria bacterium]|nr:response regulator [Deltaproteobacteria bacterium]